MLTCLQSGYFSVSFPLTVAPLLDWYYFRRVCESKMLLDGFAFYMHELVRF